LSDEPPKVHDETWLSVCWWLSVSVAYRAAKNELVHLMSGEVRHLSRRMHAEVLGRTTPVGDTG